MGFFSLLAIPQCRALSDHLLSRSAYLPTKKQNQTPPNPSCSMKGGAKWHVLHHRRRESKSQSHGPFIESWDLPGKQGSIISDAAAPLHLLLVERKHSIFLIISSTNSTSGNACACFFIWGQWGLAGNGLQVVLFTSATQALRSEINLSPVNISSYFRVIFCCVPQSVAGRSFFNLFRFSWQGQMKRGWWFQPPFWVAFQKAAVGCTVWSSCRETAVMKAAYWLNFLLPFRQVTLSMYTAQSVEKLRLWHSHCVCLAVCCNRLLAFVKTNIFSICHFLLWAVNTCKIKINIRGQSKSSLHVAAPSKLKHVSARLRGISVRATHLLQRWPSHGSLHHTPKKMQAQVNTPTAIWH